MRFLPVVVFFVASLGALCTSTPCYGDIKAVARDGETCHECGKSKLTARYRVGQQTASLGDFPWSAAVYSNRSTENSKWRLTCGGTLISSQAVLTAAHCVTTGVLLMNASDIKVVLGKTQRSWFIKETAEIRRKVREIRVHPDYIASNVSYTSDIALLLLESKVPFSKAVLPACLDLELSHLPLYNEYSIGYVSGFGDAKKCGSNCSNTEERLKYKNTYVWGSDICFNSSEIIVPCLNTSVTSDKFCIRGSRFKEINGGSGLTMVSQGLHYVTGLASFKFSALRFASTSSIVYYNSGTFTNVSCHINWLKKNIPE